MPKADCPEVLVIWSPSERQEIEVHIFDRVNLLGFTTRKLTSEEDINPRKHTFLLNVGLWPTQKKKNLVYF